MTDSIKKTGFTYGIALGIVLTTITCYIHFFDLKLITNVWLGALTLGLIVLFGILSIIKTKSNLGGFITFKEAFSSFFYTIITSSIISCLTLIILYSVIISPETKAIIKQQTVEFNLKIMKQINSTPSEINAAKVSFQDADPFSVYQTISSSIKYLLRDCIIGFLVALIFRNKRTLQ
jgi:hypothetical protein